MNIDTPSKTLMTMMAIALGCFGASAGVSAHVMGPSFEVKESGYFIDVGYEDARVGQSVRLDFSLFKDGSTTTDEEDYSDVWVNISEGPKVLFAGDIHRPPFGKTGMTFVPAVAGNYTVSVRFQNGVDSVVATTFSLPVAGLLHASRSWLLYGFASVGLVVMVSVVYVLQRRGGNPPKRTAR